jgi:hypothetical protein
MCWSAIAVLTLWGTLGDSDARAQNIPILINEINLNSENDAPSGSDDTTEYIEIRSLGGAVSLDGLTFLVIEGDGGSQGTIDKALSLDGFSTGSNGLFLWRDSADVLLPAPDAATVIKVEDFSPDLENGSATFAIVRGFTGTEGDDLDTDDDSTIDSPGSLPWSEVLDAVGVRDSGSSDGTYAGQLLSGATDFPNVSYAADTLVRLTNNLAWIAVDIDEGASGFPGPYPFDDSQAEFSDGTPFTPSTALDFNIRTPGNHNPSLIPEPVSSILLGLAVGLGAFRRRRD